MPERFFLVHARPEMADTVVANEARARGVTPRTRIDLGWSRGDLLLMVIGEFDGSQGRDADGAPTSDWPRPSWPWTSRVESSLVCDPPYSEAAR